MRLMVMGYLVLALCCGDGVFEAGHVSRLGSKAMIYFLRAVH